MGAAIEFDAFRDSLLEQTRKIGEQLNDPDDDWSPMLFAVSEDGMVIMAIDPALMATGGAKDVLAEIVIPEAIRKTNAVQVGLLLSVWSLWRQPGRGKNARKRMLRDLEWCREHGVSEHPDRTEVLVLHLADQLRFEVWHAPISRDERKVPTLGEWVMMPESTMFEGRFIEPMMQALRHLEDR